MSDTPERRPNMQQIGEAAGVSKSAVSLALRNDPRLPEATRLRIQKIAREMGYRRNPVVDSLMAQLRIGRQPTFRANLGLINCSSSRDYSENMSYRLQFEGIGLRAKALGYGIEEFWLRESSMRPQLLKQIMETRGIRGLILLAALRPDTMDHEYVAICQKYACAAVGGAHLNNWLSRTSADQYLTARRAAEKVLELGYKRPMLVVPAQEDALLEHRLSAGFYSVTRILRHDNRLEPIDLNVADPGAALLAVRKQKPDVVITTRSELYEALHNDGVCIPKDLGFVHLDWHDGLAHMAGMHQNNRVVGSAGVDLVVGQVQKNECGAQEFPQSVQIESGWIDGPSVCRA